MSFPSKIYYIGSFPPPYGGVTVKNALLCKYFSEWIEINIVNLSMAKKMDLRIILKLCRCLFCREGILVLGVTATWRKQLTNFLYRFNKSKMKRSVMFVMGGIVPEDSSYIAKLATYRRIYVETDSMKRLFEERGADNVSVYPNCRERPKDLVKIKECGRQLNGVFFSLISPDKGARIVLDASKITPEVKFHFYGRIEKGFSEEFLSVVRDTENVEYHGVFDSVNCDAIAELNQYDVHLFPTLWPKEGVPGVLVETKLAGVPTIATNVSMIAELIEDGVDGILMQSESAEELSSILTRLSENPEVVELMKVAALESSELYCIDRYIDDLVSDLVD